MYVRLKLLHMVGGILSKLVAVVRLLLRSLTWKNKTGEEISINK